MQELVSKETKSRRFVYNAPSPTTFCKSGDNGFVIKGVASTSRRDLQGEIINTKGIEVSDEVLVNWNHMGRMNPEYIIGKTVNSYINDSNEFIIEARIYDNKKIAKTIKEDLECLSKGGDAPSYFYSVEGTVIERASDDSTHITKSLITGVAVTTTPANMDCRVYLDESLSPEGFSKAMNTFVYNKSMLDGIKDVAQKLEGDSEPTGRASDRKQAFKFLGVDSMDQLSKKKLNAADAAFVLEYIYGFSRYTAADYGIALTAKK